MIEIKLTHKDSGVDQIPRVREWLEHVGKILTEEHDWDRLERDIRFEHAVYGTFTYDPEKYRRKK